MVNSTILTFGPYDLDDVKAKCASLINEAISFKVRLVVDQQNKPTHWEVEY